jgi:protein Mpv17
MATNTLMAPIGISLVFTSITLLKGQSVSQAQEKVSKDMPRTFLAGSCYWPFVSFINFRFVPLDSRPFVGSVAGTVWNIYISSVANKEQPK